MKIEILGVNCNKCIYFHKLVEKHVQEMGLDAEVLFVDDMEKILSYGVMMTPALIVDGKVKCVGRLPQIPELKKWLQSGAKGKLCKK